MTVHKTLPKKTYVLLACMITCGSLGDVLLSKGMKQVGEVPLASFSELFGAFMSAFTSGTIWLGILFLIGNFVCYMLVLSWADYSYVLPASAMNYVVVSLLGTFWLGEVVGRTRWMGIALICLGVMAVGSTSHNTTSTAGVPPERSEEQS